MKQVNIVMKPKRFRETSKDSMENICQHLLPIRAATIDQLAALTGVKVDALRNRIKRYRLISTGKKALTRCVSDRPTDAQSWKWKSASNVTVYGLNRVTALTVEAAVGETYYREAPRSNPISSDKDVIRHTVQMTDLYVRMFKRGIGDFRWLHSQAFQAELNLERDGKGPSVNITCGGLVPRNDYSFLYGFSIFDGDLKNGLRRMVKQLVPDGDDVHCYELVVFVTNHRSGQAARMCAGLPPRWITIRNPSLPGLEPTPMLENSSTRELKSDSRSRAIFLPYEWSLSHADIVLDVLHKDWERVMSKLLQHKLGEDKSLTYVEQTGWWQIVDSDGTVCEYVTSAIGRSARFVANLAKTQKNYLALEGIRRRVLVATDEEKSVWEDVKRDYGGIFVFEVAKIRYAQ